MAERYLLNMNNLKKLRKQLDISTRELSEYVGISYTVLSYLENAQRPFRQAHIDKLTAFLNVTSDYLLGRSDNGYIVRPEYGDEELVLTENEYNRLRENISVSIVQTKPFDLTITSSVEEKTIILPPRQVYRELKGSVDDYDMKDTLMVKWNNLGKKMTEDELKKAIRFVEDFIFK